MSARYERLDSDSSNLPANLERVGYDSDRQVYSYRDENNNYWEGDEGNRLGPLRRAGHNVDSSHSVKGVRFLEREAWRYILPFVLLVCVFLLGVFKIVNRTPTPLKCGQGLEPFAVSKGETCWDIATKKGITVTRLEEINSDLDCDKLVPDMQICVLS